jgi:hypothetical protein
MTNSEQNQQGVPAQSQSQAGPTNENPNEDVNNGTQSQVQPGEGNDAATGSVPSDGGNPAANQGGSNGEGAPAGGGQ